MAMSTTLRILHGHVDKIILERLDAQIYSVRFQKDPMPIDACRAVLLLLPNEPDYDTTLELVGRIALENEALKKRVEELERTCMQMAEDHVTDANEGRI
jgi:hypothetical protein